jgi:hypothetical protein
MKRVCRLIAALSLLSAVVWLGAGVAMADGVCAPGWTQDGAYGDGVHYAKCYRDVSGVDFATASAAVDGLALQTSQHDLSVDAFDASLGFAAGSSTAAFTGDGGPEVAFHAPVVPGHCPCVLRFVDWGEDYGDGGPAFLPSAGYQAALDSFVSGGYVAFSDPVGAGVDDPAADGFGAGQVALTAYIALGVGVVAALAVLGIGATVLVRYLRRSAADGWGHDWGA